jgi:O-antigen ligase
MFALSLTLGILSLVLLAVRPTLGIPAVFIARPFVDTLWPDMIGPIRPTEVYSVAVPFLVMIHLAFASGSSSFRRMPMRWLWVIWVIDVAMFSGMILYNNKVADGFNIFFRHLNGFVGFYMLQAWFADERYTKRLLSAMVIAGVFPMATGVYEALTGDHWKITLGEGGLIRNIGMYHDGITIRYLALQTILAVTLFTTLYLHRRWISSLLSTAYGAVCAFVMYGAYSKAGIVTLGSWLLIWPTLLRKVRTLVVFGVAGLILAGAYSDKIVDTVSVVFNKEIGVAQGELGVDRSFSGRWYTWKAMLEERESFTSTQRLFGSGQMALGAHNDYIQVLFHGGVVGLLLYIGLLLGIFVRIVLDLLRRMDPWSVAALLAFIMWMVDTIGLVPSAYSGYQWFVWGIIGLAFRKRDDARRAARVAAPAQIGAVSASFDPAMARAAEIRG